MNGFIKTVFTAKICAVALTMAANAQDADKIIEELTTGTLPIMEKSTPILLPFAVEWDANAAIADDLYAQTATSEYQALMVPDVSRLQASVEALANNAAAKDFYTDDETIAAFRSAYEDAAARGSTIGMIPRDDAMRYWILSRTVASGPEAVADYRPGYASPEWCLPPLIRCTPPRPAPKE